MAAAEKKLSAFLKGEFKPATSAEQLVMAEVCFSRKRYRASAGLYAAAFAAEPALADDLTQRHRYGAAMSAALAAAGKDEDPPGRTTLDDKERARLRKQALDCLRADLALLTKQLESGQPAHRYTVQSLMNHWRRDPDLAAIRDSDALAMLAEPERKACERLWADVSALLQKAIGPPSLASLMQQLPEARKALPKDSPQLAGLLAQIGLGLQQEKKWTEAEPLLRECLAIREKAQPDEWTTFNTRSLLGGSLLGQKKYAEAEPLILSGYEGMKAREAKIPPPGKTHFTDAAERVVRLYEEWGKKAKAAEWRTKLAKPTDGTRNES